MAGRYTTDRARLYDELEDALAALDVAGDAIRNALAAASYPHLREAEVTETEEATLAATGVA